MTRPQIIPTALAAAALCLGCSESPSPRSPFEDERSSIQTLRIATWNLSWLDADVGAGINPRTEADYAALADYAERLDADVVAVQEVDGPVALRRVFDPDEYDVHVSSRNHAQRTGFAIRKSLDATPLPDYTALDVGYLRRGTELALEIDGRTVRLMSVHLKSGCFSGSLTRSSACRTLARQLEPLEEWIDARAAEDVPFAVLGDFNRRFFASANDQAWTRLDDGQPSGADLSSPTQEGSPQCQGGKYSHFVDHIVTGAELTERIVPGSFEQIVYDEQDEGFELSDHCPLSVELSFEGDDEPEPDPWSCAGWCGERAPGGCWCDDLCEDFGNCCDDVADACSEPEPEASCDGYCGEQAPAGCWCNDLCVTYGDCCDDFSTACG